MDFNLSPGSVNLAYDPRYWIAETLPRHVLGYYRGIPIVDGNIEPTIIMRTRFVLPIQGWLGHGF